MTALQILREKSFMTVACLIVSLQLFNISFDPSDHLLGNEDVAINEIESCVELLLEIVMDQEGAIEESDESDEDANKPGATAQLYTIFNSPVAVENVSIPIKSYQPLFKSAHVESLTLPIISPPPKML